MPINIDVQRVLITPDPIARVVVKPDATNVVYTGGTSYTFVESGATQISQVGAFVTIYTPVIDISGKLDIDIFSGYTGTTDIRLDDIETDITQLSAATSSNTQSIAQLSAFTSGLTGTYVEVSVFSGYTGTTDLRLDDIETDIIQLSAVTSGNTQSISALTGVVATKLNESTFTGYTATTEIRLDNIEADVFALSAATSGLTNYNFIESGATDILVSGSNVTIYTPVVDTSTFVSTPLFTGYTATTEIRLDDIEIDIVQLSAATSGLTGSYVELSVFSGYTGATDIRIDNVETDIDQLSAFTSGLTGSYVEVSVFSGYTGATDIRIDNVEADILSLSAKTANAVTGVTQGTGGINVDNTNPKNPIISLNSTLYVPTSTFNNYTGTTTNQINQLSGATSGNTNSINQLSGVTSGNTTVINLHTQQINQLSGVTSGNTNSINQLSGVTSGNTNAINYISGVTSGLTEQINSLDFENIHLTGGTGWDLYDWFNQTQSAGRLTSGGDITDNGNGTVYVPSGTGLIKSDSPSGCTDCFANWQPTTHVSWDSVASLPMVNNAYNFIYFNGTLSAITATTNFYSISPYKDFTLGRGYRIDNETIVRLCGTNLWNFNRRVQTFGEEVFPIVRASGMIVGETGTRNITVSAGILWAELVNRFTTTAKNTASGDTFTAYYRAAVSGFTSLTGQTQINNTQYDDGDGTLGTLTNTRYGVHWVYIVHDSSIHVVFGQDEYTLTAAEQAQPPASIPGLLSSYGTLVAKIIIQKNAASFTEIQSAFDTTFQSENVAVHNDLSGLQGGTAGEYYHLTNSQLTSVGTISNKLDIPVFSAYTGTTKNQIDQISASTSGATNYNFIGSGATEVAVSGGNVIIYSPTGATSNLNFIGSGATEVSVSGDNVTIYSPTGGSYNFVGSGGTDVITSGSTIIISSPTSGISYNFIESGATDILIDGSDITIYTPVVDSSTFVTTSNFTGYTATTQIALDDKVDISVYNDDLQILSDKIDSITGGTTGGTSGTSYTFIGSGATTVDVSGDNVTIYTPIVDISSKLDTVIFSAYTGTTDIRISDIEIDIIQLSAATSGATSYNFIESGATDILVSGNDITIYTPVVDTSSFVSTPVFSGYTGTTENNINAISAATSANTESIIQLTANTQYISISGSSTFISGSDVTIQDDGTGATELKIVQSVGGGYPRISFHDANLTKVGELQWSLSDFEINKAGASRLMIDGTDFSTLTGAITIQQVQAITFLKM